MSNDVLITGATGLLGNAITRLLISKGRRVKALVRNPQKAESIVPKGCELVPGDVTDAASILRAAKDCQVIYHAAGLPEQWLADPSEFDRVNVDGTRNVIDAAKSIKVHRFIYTSTIDIFRFPAPNVPFDETEIDEQPKNTHYERSKQKADRLVTAALGEGLPAVFLHPSGIYGEGPLTSPGVNHLIMDLVRGKVPMLLDGVAPVVYSDDVALGHELAETSAPIGGRYILSESSHSLVAVAEAVRRDMTKRDKPTKVPPVLPLGVAHVVAHVGEWISSLTKKPPLLPKGQLEFIQYGANPSSERAKKELGWNPRSFEKGLSDTLDFMKAQGKI